MEHHANGAGMYRAIACLPALTGAWRDHGGGLAYMSKTRSAKSKFQTFVDRIATDAPGYSGFLDAIKIGPDDLAVIYSFDQALLESVRGSRWIHVSIPPIYSAPRRQALTTQDGVAFAPYSLAAGESQA